MTTTPNDGRHLDELKCRSLVEALGLARAGALGSVFNASVVAVTMWSTAHAVLIALWWLTVVVVAIVRSKHAEQLRRADFSSVNVARDRRIVEHVAVASGALWCLSIAFSATIATPAQFIMLAMLSGGMMGAAVMTYGPMPRAAIAFISLVFIGCAIALLVYPGAPTVAGLVLSASYFFVLLRGVLTSTELFTAKHEAESALRDSAETVQLLLHDYEAQSSDWLWEVDAAGTIHNANSRFADASGRSQQLLDGLPYLELFDDARERDMLREHMAQRSGFRDLTLKLTIDGSPRWWTLSAQPRGDGTMRGVATDVTAEKRAEARVSYMAHYDGLTDLANRFLFNDTLQRTLNRMRHEQKVAVLCLDLDQFKSVNDTLGHPVGDKLLCEVARRVESSVRELDLVARLGGDEFAVLITGIEGDTDIDACAQRIVATLSQPFVLDGMQVMTSTSIGIAVAATKGQDAATLMKQADLALYTAKANGRNRAAYFEAGMDEAARERRDLEMDLRAALVRNEFELHYQPLVNVVSGATVSYEALIRWNHPTRGVVMPNTFIPLAEETGLIVQLGEWVIRQATTEAANWPTHLRVSVNLSPAQMRSANLISTVINAVARAGIAPDRLELEITESVLMNDSDVNIATLHKLRDFGVRISLDDFGTGYSSLNYLRSFPFNKIKIDKCFVEDIENSEDCRAIIRAVTGLATSLGMVTTAEGVEHLDQLARLRTEGCTEVQGYLYSRPSRAEEFTDLRQRRPKLTAPELAAVDIIVPAAPVTDEAASISKKAVSG
jgi:diguanylate cyclase (GGDEF)-like protein/PAS domain S-box-containing protein